MLYNMVYIVWYMVYIIYYMLLVTLSIYGKCFAIENIYQSLSWMWACWCLFVCTCHYPTVCSILIANSFMVRCETCFHESKLTQSCCLLVMIYWAATHVTQCAIPFIILFYIKNKNEEKLLYKLQNRALHFWSLQLNIFIMIACQIAYKLGYHSPY
jgi:hypothetical protein